MIPEPVPQHVMLDAKKACVQLVAIKGSVHSQHVEVRDTSKEQRLLGLYFWVDKKFTSPTFDGIRKAKGGPYATFQRMRKLVKTQRHQKSKVVEAKNKGKLLFDKDLPKRLCQVADNFGLLVISENKQVGMQTCRVYCKTTGLTLGLYYWTTGNWYAGKNSGKDQQWEDGLRAISDAWPSRRAAQPHSIAG